MTQYIEPTGMGGIVVVDDYPGFKNLYVYPEYPARLAGIPIGAVTISKSSNEIVAEAKVISKLTMGGNIEIEEFHYANCTKDAGCCLLFKSQSSIKHSFKERRE